MEPCPFCDSEKVENIVGGVESFSCDTNIIQGEAIGSDRGKACYEQEIRNLKVLLGDADKILQSIENQYPVPGPKCPCFPCQLSIKASALLPRIRAILEIKP